MKTLLDTQTISAVGTSYSPTFQAGASESGINAVEAQQNVTDASGTTPTLDTTVQYSFDGGATWHDTTAFAQTAIVSEETISPAQIAPLYRLKYVVGGTSPVFTFTTALFAH